MKNRNLGRGSYFEFLGGDSRLLKYRLTEMTYEELFQFFQRRLYFCFAQVSNAGLGHTHASMAATLALRICTSCNTLRLGYTKINFRTSLALWVFVIQKLLQLFQCRFIFGNDILLCSQLYSFSVDDRLGSS